MPLLLPVPLIDFLYPFQGMVVQSYNHDIKAKTVSIFEVKLTLLLRNLRKSDVGTYICISKNSLGEAQSSIRVYGEL